MSEHGVCQHLNKTWHKFAEIYYWRCPDCQQEHYYESFGVALSRAAVEEHKKAKG